MAETSNEPERLAAYSNGFLFLPTAGMRLAPELLVLELFREVCYGGAPNADDASAHALDPLEIDATNPEGRAVGFALRGRKLERNGSSYFYAPAYPELASLGWLRRKSDRVVRDFFLKGALAVACRTGAIDKSVLADATTRAIYGSESSIGKDVFQRCANSVKTATRPADQEVARATVEGHLDSNSQWGLEQHDVISSRIAEDWLSLCRLEPFIPRLAWVGMVATFLRVAIPLWLLAQMRVTVIVRDALRQAISGDSVSIDVLRGQIANRHQRLLVPSQTLTDSVDDLVVTYMRSRCETNLVFLELAKADATWSARLGQPLSLAGGSLPLTSVTEGVRLLAARNPTLLQDIIRQAESYSAWVSPLAKGQGKNIEEFLRVLRNDHVGESDDAYLLERGPRNRRLFRVFPAQRVLAMYCLLTHAHKWRKDGPRSRLILSDLEATFREVGVDFSIVGGSRAQLLKELSARGILAGTPDAGDGVELNNPYLSSLTQLAGAAS